jgi:hypothetical protein
VAKQGDDSLAESRAGYTERNRVRLDVQDLCGATGVAGAFAGIEIQNSGTNGMVDEVRSETEVPGAGYLNRHN